MFSKLLAASLAAFSVSGQSDTCTTDYIDVTAIVTDFNSTSYLGSLFVGFESVIVGSYVYTAAESSDTETTQAYTTSTAAPIARRLLDHDTYSDYPSYYKVLVAGTADAWFSVDDDGYVTYTVIVYASGAIPLDVTYTAYLMINDNKVMVSNLCDYTYWNYAWVFPDLDDESITFTASYMDCGSDDHTWAHCPDDSSSASYLTATFGAVLSLIAAALYF